VRLERDVSYIMAMEEEVNKFLKEVSGMYSKLKEINNGL
jgi:hypothetical protein